MIFSIGQRGDGTLCLVIGLDGAYLRHLAQQTYDVVDPIEMPNGVSLAAFMIIGDSDADLIARLSVLGVIDENSWLDTGGNLDEQIRDLLKGGDK